MILGPNQIVACSHCGALAHYRVLVSGNTLGAVVWTDGRQCAVMMKTPPAVVKCHACATCYWLAHAREIGTVARDFRAKGPVPEAWSKAPEVKEPGADEYLDAIEAGLAKDLAQEKWLRILAWWRANDSSRDWTPDADRAPAASRDGFRRNLRRLVELLTDDTDDERVMKAEVLRELGQFKAAEAALGEVASRDFDWVVERIRTLCKARKAKVAKLTGAGATRPRSRS